MITSCVVELAEATCARVPHHIYTHPLRRSGLLPFFSPPVIQEWLINFAGERQRSRMTSHCEIILGFCLSASHPVKLSSEKQRLKPFEVSPHDCKQSLAANLRTVIASKRFSSHPVISSDSKTRPIVQRSFGILRSRP